MPRLKLLFLWLSHLVSFVLSAQPLFEENRGQWPSQVLVYAAMPNAEMYFEGNRIRWNLRKAEDAAAYHEFHHRPQGVLPRLHLHTIQMELVSCQLGNLHFKGNTSSTNFNYFSSKVQIGGIKRYSAFVQKEVYPGIHMHFQKNQDLKYEFEVSPHAKPEQIRMKWTGQQGLYINEKGELVLETSVGEMIEQKPYAYQILDNGSQVPIECHFVLNQDEISFDLGPYDSSKPLIVDPVLVFSSYSGSSSDNWGFTSTFDQAGNLYVAGIVFGAGYPITLGAYDTSFAGVTDIAIMKFNPDGTNLIYSTYLGGSNNEQPHSLICANDELVLMGVSGSPDFPVSSNAYQNTFAGGTPTSGTGATFHAGTDIIVCRFSADGTQLLASTFVGGSGNDGLNGQIRNQYGDDTRGEIIVNQAKEVFVASSSLSQDFPLMGAGLNTVAGGGQEGVVFKLSADLSQLLWGSYVSTQGNDAALGLQFGANDTLYVCGATAGDSLFYNPVGGKNSFLGGSTDAYIALFEQQNGEMLNFKYVGTQGRDVAFFIDTDPIGRPCILGQTDGVRPTVPTNLYGDNNSRQFVMMLSNGLDQDLRFTRIGRGVQAYDFAPSAFRIDSCGVLYLAGWGGPLASPGSSVQGLYVSNNAFQSTTDGNDFYFLSLDLSWQEANYATYFGGSGVAEHVDGGTSRFSKKGVISQAICAGCGGVSTTPAQPSSVWSPTNNSTNCNMMGVKMAFEQQSTQARINLLTDTVCLGDTARFMLNSANANVVYWDFGDGNADTVSGIEQWVYNQTGAYQILVKAYNAFCGSSDSDSVMVYVIDPSNNALFTVDYDSCDVDYKARFALSGSFINPSFHTTTGVVLNSNPVDFSYSNPGIYKPWVSYTSSACSQTYYDTLTVKFNALKLSLNVQIDYVPCRDGLQLKLVIQNRPDIPITIDFGDGNDSAGRGAFWVYQYQQAGNYTIKVSIEDSTCKQSQVFEKPVSIGLGVPPERQFPNVFTPNGDGLNDVLDFETSLGFSLGDNSQLNIFNRWGQLVFTGRAIWDGKFSNTLCAPGVYFWTLTLDTGCGDLETHRGLVHLMN